MEPTIVMVMLNVSTQMEVSSASVTMATLEAELSAEVNRSADPYWIDNQVKIIRYLYALFKEPLFTINIIRDTTFTASTSFYHPPTKLRNGNVFSHVCRSVCSHGIPCDHYPWCIGPHHPGHVQTCSTWTSLYREASNPTLCPWTPSPGPTPGHVQTCSLWSRYDWKVGGWHPTGMLSWFIFSRARRRNAETLPTIFLSLTFVWF